MVTVTEPLGFNPFDPGFRVDPYPVYRLALERGSMEIIEDLRYDPPVQFTARVALDDIDIDGATIGKGDQAIVLVAVERPEYKTNIVLRGLAALPVIFRPRA